MPIKADTAREATQAICIQDLERELQSLRDQLASDRRSLRTARREAALREALLAEIRQTAPRLAHTVGSLKPQPRPKGKTVVEDCVLHLSDEHADQIIVPEQTGGLEDYNFHVACARAERLVETVTDYTHNTLVNYKFDRLWIFAHGDHVSGEIHDGLSHSAYRNAMRNALAVGHLHACMFRDLAAAFPRLHVVYISGNHGRRQPKKGYTKAWDNWDYLVGYTAKIACSSLPVDFVLPDAFSININVRGHIFNVTHGDEVKAWSGIPYYGIERATRRLLAIHAARDQKINYFVRGHFHNASSITHPTGEVLLNGAWIATTEYIYGALGGYTRPSQLLHGVHDVHGVTWRLPIYLKFAGDTDGPRRYKIDLDG